MLLLYTFLPISIASRVIVTKRRAIDSRRTLILTNVYRFRIVGKERYCNLIIE